MNDAPHIDTYLVKALESLVGADREFGNRRYHNCANRLYYACFQAAIAALVQEGIAPSGRDVRWGHDFVQAQFAGQLIGRRKVYATDLRETLTRTYLLRQAADYTREMISRTQAERAIRRAREFVEAVLARGDEPR